MVNTPLSAPLNNAFDYTRSVGPTIGAFLTGLRRKQLTGGRGSDGRVYVPPPEYDSVTKEPITEFVDVGSSGTVLSWSWVPNPYDGQPLDHPFAFALIQLDGADTAILHAVDAGSSTNMATGMRVHARWAEDRVGDIHDIECFEPGEGDDQPHSTGDPGADAVTMITTPVRL